jgi:plasmid stabilization system protein ParE
MNGDQGFELHPGAVQDIIDIWQFIAQENSAAATRFRNAILDAVRKLVNFPHQGRTRLDLTSRPLRFQVILNYLIAYAP